MTIAKLAWLSSPGEGRYVLNFQPFGTTDVSSFEIGPDQMRGILLLGFESMMHNMVHRVPLQPRTQDGAHERTGT
jgi:hypothetical protein